MTNEIVTKQNALKPIRCGCGGEAILETDHDTIQPVAPIDWKRVRCNKCNIRTTWRKSEAEAIEVWNRAMGNRDNLERVEPKTFVVPIVSKAKYVKFVHDGEKFAHGWTCQNCGGYVQENDKYCKNCGCRLEWK